MPWRYKLIDDDTNEHINTISIRNEDEMDKMLEIAATLGYHMELDYYRGDES